MSAEEPLLRAERARQSWLGDDEKSASRARLRGRHRDRDPPLEPRAQSSLFVAPVWGSGDARGRWTRWTSAAFPSVLAQVRSGATSEHDEGGDHALARGPESSITDTAFAGKRRLALFADLVCLARRSSSSGRPHPRDGGCEDQGRREGCMVSRAGFRVLDFPTSSSSADCRSSSQRVRGAARDGPNVAKRGQRELWERRTRRIKGFPVTS